ncbi:hypothetical protein DFO46_3308 [Rhizobium sp. AG855]|nr:hypothetical protein DFO46_3308 [Rhizobium sp. AG855]
MQPVKAPCECGPKDRVGGRAGLVADGQAGCDVSLGRSMSVGSDIRITAPVSG